VNILEANRYLKSLKKSRVKNRMKLSFTVSKILLTAIERGGSFKKEIPQVIEERFKKQPRPIKEDIRQLIIKMQSSVNKELIYNLSHITEVAQKLDKDQNDWSALRLLVGPKLLDFLSKHIDMTAKEFFYKLIGNSGQLDKIFDTTNHIL